MSTVAGFEKIIKSVKKGNIEPVYGFDGEEAYYLDILTDFFENQLLSAAERDFNQTVFYGKDAEWQEIINACRRFPMFAPRQLVLVKDAAQLKGLSELVAYLESPAPTTVLVIEHRGKKFDGRSKLLKLLKEKGVVFTSEKVKDEQVPQWISDYAKLQGIEIGTVACELLATFLGNDLQRIANEIEKVRLNLKPQEALTPELIQKYIGISKEYNIFELPEAFAGGHREKFSRMVAYFTANPKSAVMPLVIGSFYSYFNQLYLTHFTARLSAKDAAIAMNIWSSKVSSLRKTAERWPLPNVEKALLLIGTYSAASVGVEHHAKDVALLKEMLGKLQLIQPS